MKIHDTGKLPVKDINGVDTFAPAKGNNVYTGGKVNKGQTVKITSGKPGTHNVINNLVNSGDLVLGGLILI